MVEMENPVPSLWLHAYSGRENGLMIIGTPAAIKSLGQRLVEASNPEAITEATSWPRAIVAPDVVGPYKDVRGFGLSFHLQGAEPLDKVAPFTRRRLWLPLFVLVALLAIVGLVTVWHWLSSLLGSG
jgi:hypothetical protein